MNVSVNVSASALDDVYRARLALLADALIPASGGNPVMPSASAAGVASHGVDRVLIARPDLAAPLAEALSLPGEPADVVALLRSDRPAIFAALGEIVAGAYYLEPDIQDLIGYHGRASAPVELEPDLDETLLAPVIARGPIFRPDPRP
jgi:hypothetical protein